ncbi:hypothetical protein [Pseudanabaena sp. PCC 6802]|uniref:AbiTii domain-containing protein n=1 Tax=Pseudanabaena sp. PCC 6802 TaxID=118173 RepID=UPI00034DF358|nr:hypothetical protein [Pseudanabaena sp. PCC 6802]
MPDNPSSLDAVLVALETEPLSAALLELNTFAEASGQVELCQWAIAELHGYSGNETYPSYRNLSLQYFDGGGQAIPSLSEQYGSWPVLNGVQQLELQIKHGLTIKPPPEVLDFLSQACDRQVFGGHVNPETLQQLLAAIRTEAINRLGVISR